MVLWIYILVSMVVMQFFLAAYVINKIPFVRSFNIKGVSIKTLYLLGVFLSPLLAPIILLVAFVGTIKGFFVKKVPAKPFVFEEIK